VPIESASATAAFPESAAQTNDTGLVRGEPVASCSEVTGSTPQIKAYVFDIGETLIDESRIWLRWAQRLGVPVSTFVGLIGAAAALDQPLMGVFELVKPGFNLNDEEAAWAVAEPASLRSGFDDEDLYPDVIPALSRLRDGGYRVIIAGNQPPAALAALRTMKLPVELIANSAEIGFEKPAPEFFSAVIERAVKLDPALAAPGSIAYVGDRLDNDVLPAAASGLVPILIRRGPWGFTHAARPAAQKVKVIDSLLDLPL